VKTRKNPKNRNSRGDGNKSVKAFGVNVIYGKHPVLMAVLHGKRELRKIFLTEKTEKVFHEFVAKHKIKLPKNFEIELLDGKDLSARLSEGVTHQGFLLECSSLPKNSLNGFINSLKKGQKLPNVLILDEITDPHNIGAIIRSAVAFGFKNIIVPEKNFPSENAVIAKTSAGMIELVNLIEVGNLNRVLVELKDAGYWIVGLTGEAKDFVSGVKFDNIVLVVGSEGKGIRDLVKKNCDMLVRIPMAEGVESLNASVAVAIAMYELGK